MKKIFPPYGNNWDRKDAGELVGAGGEIQGLGEGARVPAFSNVGINGDLRDQAVQVKG